MPSASSSGRRLWQDCLSAGFVLGLISSAAAQDHQPAAATDRPAPDVEAEVANGLVTLHAEGAPLAEVLRAIGEAGSFEVVLRGELASPVRDAFADQPIEDAIRRLARGHSVVVLRGDLDPASGAAAVSEVRVIENPARAALDDARSADSDRDGVAAAGADAADDPPADREAFRWSRQGVPPPTREDILFELSDPDPAIRVAAVPKVGVFEPRAALGVLAEVFAEAEDELVRSRAVAALTRLEGPGARMQLRRWALADQDPALRAQALSALATTAGERSVDVLGRALRRDPGPEVREAAIRALRRVGGARARRYVERARALDPELGFAAEQALAEWPRSAD